MDAEQIREFQRAVGQLAWKMDLWAFADALGSDASHDYTKDKFRRFQALNKELNQFDAETLARIINAAEER